MIKYSKPKEKSENYFLYDTSDSLARIVEFVKSKEASSLFKKGFDPIFIAVILEKFIPALSLDITKTKNVSGQVKSGEGAIIKTILNALKKSNIENLNYYIEKNENFVLQMYLNEYASGLIDKDKLISYLELLSKGTVINLFTDGKIIVNKYNKGQNVNYDLYIKALKLIYLYIIDNNKIDNKESEKKALKILINYILPFFPNKDFDIAAKMAQKIAKEYEISDDKEVKKIKEIIIENGKKDKSYKSIAQCILNLKIDAFDNYKNNLQHDEIKNIKKILKKGNESLCKLLKTNIDNYKETGIDNKLFKNYVKYGLLRKETEIDDINIEKLKPILKKLKKEYDFANKSIAIIINLLMYDLSGFKDIYENLKKDPIVMLIMFFRYSIEKFNASSSP